MTAEEMYCLLKLPRVGFSLVNKLNEFLAVSKRQSFKELSPVEIAKLCRETRAGEALLGAQNSYEILMAAATDELNAFKNAGYVIVSRNDHLYPHRLQRLESAPSLLYGLGNPQLLIKPTFAAVIGSRNCSETGIKNAGFRTDMLIDKGFVIVSGLALGIDSVAHQMCVDLNHPTIAVVADIKNIYPAANRRLASDIVSGSGLLLSQVPPGTKTNRSSFAQRDKLIAMLSHYTYPIEFSQGSGTELTIKLAERFGSTVLLPNIVSPKQ